MSQNNFTTTSIHQSTMRPAVNISGLPTNSNNIAAAANNTFASPQLPGARKRITNEMLVANFKSLPCYSKLISFIGDLSLACLESECRPTKVWNPPSGTEVATTSSTTTSVAENNTTTDASNNTVAESTSSPILEPESKEVHRIDIAVDRSNKSTDSANSTYTFVSPITEAFIDFFTELHTWVSTIPLEKLMKSRFGNIAFRTFQAKLRENAETWMTKIVSASPNKEQLQNQEEVKKTVEELIPYILDSFGNAVRIDYGTGHEVHFLLILYILRENNWLKKNSSSEQQEQDDSAGAEEETKVLRELCLVVLDEYWRLMNRLQQHYRLEPAGSHGVWGLDDFHHLPFILGAAQFSPSGSWKKENLNAPSSLSSSALIPTAPEPAEIPSKRSCEEIAPRNFFFRAVLNIHKTKSGMFGEHSRVLHSVSGLASWPRVLTGMIKMFEGEVLAKFLIVQHLLFGRTFKWEENNNTMDSKRNF
jgi:serine/threonine-protein phosphatase 2A activator